MTDETLKRTLLEILEQMASLEKAISQADPIMARGQANSELSLKGPLARETGLELDKAGNFIGGSALCADGQVRTLSWIGKSSDDGKPIKAAVKVGKETVSGVLVVEPAHRAGDQPAVKFVAKADAKYAKTLPPGTFKGRRAEDQLEEVTQS